MTDEQTPAAIADVIAEYLVNRDDFATATVEGSTIEVETQAGEAFYVNVEPKA